MKIVSLLTGAAVTLAIASTAGATSFAPATGATVVLGSPTVTLSGASSTASFGSPVSIFSTTGSLTAANGTGTVNGTLDFSDVVGTVTPQSIMDFMLFNDTSGGQFNFDVTSVQTTAFTSSSTSTSITLYLLGTAGDSNLGLTPSPTSETLTLNQTGSSAYSASASINSPPTGTVPEPASWALMLVGFGAAGGLMRRARKQGVASQA